MGDTTEVIVKNSSRLRESALPQRDEIVIEPDLPQIPNVEVDETVLRIGDVICINHKPTPSDEEQTYKQYVLADSFMQTEVKSVRDLDCYNLIGLALFKVESVCTITEGDVKVTERAQLIEQQRSAGRELHYGDIVQLRHLHSGLILAMSATEAAKTPGSWKVVLQSKVDSMCWLRIMPSELVRDEGSLIKYSDFMRLAFRAERLYFYLNLKQLDDDKYEVNAFQKAITWRITKFEGSNEPQYIIKFGSVIRFRHKESKGQLSVTIENEQLPWLHLLKETKSSLEQDGLDEIIADLTNQQAEGRPSRRFGVGSPVHNFNSPRFGDSTEESQLNLDTSNYYYGGLWIIQNRNRMVGGVYTLNSPCFLKSAISGKYLTQSLQLTDTPNVECYFNLRCLVDNPPNTPLVNGTESMISINDTEQKFIAFKHIEHKKGNIISRLTNQPNRANARAYTENDNKAISKGLFETLQVANDDTNFVIQVSQFIGFLYQFKTFLEKNPSQRSIEESKEYYSSLAKGYTAINSRLEKASSDNLKGLQIALLQMNFPVITIAICCKLNQLNSNLLGSFSKKFIQQGAFQDSLFVQDIKDAFLAMVSNLNLLCTNNEEISYIVARFHSEVYPLIKSDADSIGSLLSMIYRTTDISRSDSKQHLQIWFDRLESVSKRNIKQQTYLLKIINNLIQVDNKALLNYQKIFLELMFNHENPFPIIKLHIINDNRPLISFARRPGVSIEDFMKDNQFDNASPVVYNDDLCVDFIQICSDESYKKYIDASLKLYCSLITNHLEAIDHISKYNGVDINLIIKMQLDTNIPLSVRTQLLSLSSMMVLSKLNVSSFAENINKNLCFTNESLEYKTSSYFKSFVTTGDVKVNEDLKVLTSWIFKFWLYTTNEDIQVPEGGSEVMFKRATTSEKLNHLLVVMKTTYELVDRQMCGKMMLENIAHTFLYVLIGLSNDSSKHKTHHWLIGLMEEANLKYKKEGIIGDSNRLVRVVEMLAKLYGLLLDIKNYRRAKNYLILYNHYKTSFTKLNIQNLRDGVPAQCEREAQVIDELYREVDGIVLGERVLPDEISVILKSLVERFIDVPRKEFHSVEAHSFYILSLILSDIDIPQELAGCLVTIHSKIIDSSADLVKRLKSTQLILQDKLIHLKLRLDEIDAFFSYRRLKSRLREILQYNPENEPGAKNYLAETEDKLIHLMKCVQPRKNERKLVYTAQSICRLNGIYLKLLDLWGTVHPFSREVDSDGFRLINLITTCLLFIALDNPTNQKKVKKLLDPSLFDVRVPKLPAIIKETSTIVSEKIDTFRDIVERLFQKYPMSKPLEFKALLNWLTVILFNEDDSANQQIQKIVGNILIDLLPKSESPLIYLRFQGQPDEIDVDLLAAMYHLLANCAIDNPMVIYQCRKLVSAETILLNLQQPEISQQLKTSLLEIYTNVYLANIPGADSTKRQLKIAADIMATTNEVLKTVIANASNLKRLSQKGALSYVVNLDNPVLFDIMAAKFTEPQASVDVWKCLFNGDLWENKNGILFFVRSAISLASEKSDISLVDCAKQTVERLNSLMTELRSVVLRNPEINISILTDCIESTQRKLDEYIRKSLGPNEPFSQSAPVVQSFPRTVTFNSTSEPSDEELMKDENMEHFIDYLASRGYIKQTSSKIEHIANQLLKIKKVSSVFAKSVSAEEIQICSTELEKMQMICTTTKNRTELFSILTKLVNYGDKDDEYNTTYFSEVLVKANILDTLLSSILESDSFKEMHSALKLLLTLVEKRAGDIQDKFIEALKSKGRDFALFMLIKTQLAASRQRIISYAVQAERRSWDLTRHVHSRAKLKVESKVIRQIAYTTMLMKLLQAACDNCHKGSQNFMRLQNSQKTINMIEVISTYFIDVVGQFKCAHEEALQMIAEAIQAMIEFATGPCEDNQKLLVNNVQLFQSINLLMENIHEIVLMKPQISDNLKGMYITVYQKLTKLIHTFLEGASREAHAKILIRQLNMGNFKLHVETIYESFIKERSHSVKLEIMESPLKDGKEKSEKQKLLEISYYDFELIKTGISLAILITILKQVTPNHPILFTCKSDKEIKSNELKSRLFRKVRVQTKDCYDFFNSFIGCVEVIYNGNMEIVYFPIPFKCKFLTSSSKYEIIYSVSRNSQQEKIEDFLQKVNVAIIEMKEQQLLSRKKGLKALTSCWSQFYFLSYLLILTINGIMIGTIKDNRELELDSNDTVSGPQVAMTVLGALQLFFTVLGFVCYIIEYKKKIIEERKLRQNGFEIEDYYGIQHNDSILMKDKYEKLNSNPKTVLRNLTSLIMHKETVYHVFFFLPLSFMSLFYPILYPWLLLDIVKRSDSIRNIVKSISLNLFQLMMTALLGLIVIYIFSVIGFMYFQDCYDNCDNHEGENCKEARNAEVNGFCDTLSDCFITTLTFGIRYGGGIGDGIKSPVKGEISCDYWSRMLFDLLFFVVIILILLNIIFGIIIDTYADLKEKRLKMKDDVDNVCYICGGKKTELEQDAKGWSEHFMNKHSVFSYLSFIVYIKDKEEEDCNGLEKYVKSQISDKNIEFFPIFEGNAD